MLVLGLLSVMTGGSCYKWRAAPAELFAPAPAAAVLLAIAAGAFTGVVVGLAGVMALTGAVCTLLGAILL